VGLNGQPEAAVRRPVFRKQKVEALLSPPLVADLRRRAGLSGPAAAMNHAYDLVT
jgi:hypothetical protein